MKSLARGIHAQEDDPRTACQESDDDCRAAHLRETDCVAGVRGLELRNVLANYLPEKSHRFAGIQPKFWLRRPFAFELRRRGYAARARRHHPAASLIPPTLLARADEVIE